MECKRDMAAGAGAGGVTRRGAQAARASAPSRTAVACSLAAARALAAHPSAPTTVSLFVTAHPSCLFARLLSLLIPPIRERRSRICWEEAGSCFSSARLADKGLATVDVRLARIRRQAAVYLVVAQAVRQRRLTSPASPAPPFLGADPPSLATSVAFPIPMQNGGACDHAADAAPPARPAAPCPRTPALAPRALFETVSSTVFVGFPPMDNG